MLLTIKRVSFLYLGDRYVCVSFRPIVSSVFVCAVPV